MIELESDRRRIEADVERVQDRTRHGHRKMQLIHRRDVRQHRRDRVALANAFAGKIRGKAPAACVGLGPSEAAAFVDRTRVVRVDRRAPGDETERRRRARSWPASCPDQFRIGSVCRSSVISHFKLQEPDEIQGNIATITSSNQERQHVAPDRPNTLCRVNAQIAQAACRVNAQIAQAA